MLHSLWNIKANFVYLPRFLFFEGGILPSKTETDSKAINALLSVWISCFPSVGHLLYGYFICADLKDASFFGSILSKNERKIVPKTVFRLNLQISKTVRTFLCIHWGMNVWWELTKSAYEWNFQFKPYLFSFIHSCVRTVKKQNMVSWIVCEFLNNVFPYSVNSQCIQLWLKSWWNRLKS